MSKTFAEHHTQRILSITYTLMKEQINEPIAILWIIISPSLLFYFLCFSKKSESLVNHNYIDSASWFYSYMASSIALFGFSFYLIGRRESGFIRSFIFKKTSISIYLASHIISYSTISLFYATIFYLTSRPTFGAYVFEEYADILLRFYASYTFYSSLGLLLALAPLRFSTANTLFSAVSFLMISCGYLGASSPESIPAKLNQINPLYFAQSIMTGALDIITALTISLTSLLISCLIFYNNFRINPVWSRY